MLKKADIALASHVTKDRLAPRTDGFDAYTVDNIEEGRVLNNFFCNSKNAFPVKVLYNVSTRSGEPQSNKILLLGKSGTGKSHLLRAMGTLFATSVDKSRLYQNDATGFMALDAAHIHIFWQQYTVALLDDIQALSDSAPAQNTLITLLDTCPQDCQCIMAFSGTSEQLKRFVPRLSTRLSECLVLNLLEADLDVRMRHMEHEAHNMGIAIDHHTVVYVAQRCNDIPSIRGILQKIRAFISVHKRNPIHNDIANILHSGNHGTVPEYLEIIQRVAKSFGVKTDDVLGGKRRQTLVQARQISMYICRTSLGLSYPELGRAFGGKDYSTVIHAVNKIQKMIDSDREMHNLVTRLSSNAA